MQTKKLAAMSEDDGMKLALKISRVEHKLSTFSDDDDEIQIIEQPKSILLSN